MNAERRKRIADIASRLLSLKEEIDAIKEEEEEYFDNMPENLQGSEKGEAAENNIGELEYAADYVQDAADKLEELINN